PTPWFVAKYSIQLSYGRTARALHCTDCSVECKSFPKFLELLLMSTLTVYMPKYPECWESCGSCASGNVFILEILVKPGDLLQFDETILILETGKVALDIPSPSAGRIVAIHVTEGDTVDAGAPLVTLEAV
ncbi:MAG: lipoyl domain-containing protein, partial [Azonexus sp.]